VYTECTLYRAHTLMTHHAHPRVDLLDQRFTGWKPGIAVIQRQGPHPQARPTQWATVRMAQQPPASLQAMPSACQSKQMKATSPTAAAVAGRLQYITCLAGDALTTTHRATSGLELSAVSCTARDYACTLSPT